MKRTVTPSASDSLARYLVEIGRYPVLTVEEEREMARTCRPALVTANLRFVVKIAYQYRSQGFKIADLIQEGNIGLMRAVEKYDPERGNRLISYAAWWIRSSIQHHILRSHSLVKIGTTQAQRRLFFALARTKRDLDHSSVEHGANSDGEDAAKIAHELHVKAGEVDEMTMRLSGLDRSLDAEAFDGGPSLVDSLAGDGPWQDHALSTAQEAMLLRRRIGAVLAGLDSRERHIIEQRFMSDDPVSLKDVGEHFGISSERARQLELRAKRKLKLGLADIAIDVDWPTQGDAHAQVAERRLAA
jgi:RNA polymerase sigma-32 factor